MNNNAISSKSISLKSKMNLDIKKCMLTVLVMSLVIFLLAPIACIIVGVNIGNISNNLKKPLNLIFFLVNAYAYTNTSVIDITFYTSISNTLYISKFNRL